MIYLKKLLKALIYTFSGIIIGSILVTLISYLSEGIVYKTIKVLIPFISIFIGGLIIGKNSKNKGWFEGIKYGGIVVFLLLIIGLLFSNNTFEIKRIIYYLIMIFTATIGSMLGISKDIDK